MDSRVNHLCFGFGSLSLPSFSSDCVFFLASDLEPCLVMGGMSEGFSVDSAAPPGWAVSTMNCAEVRVS